MNAEISYVAFDAGAEHEDPQQSAIHLEMRTSKSVRYSILHTRQPVFSLDEHAILDVVGDRPVLFVVDRKVDALYGHLIRNYAQRHLDAVGFVVIHGEESEKTWRQAELICNAAMDCGLGRAGVIVGVGGGVALDISGFAASIYRRGIGYLRIPTTLIGQVDVSVGVKQGINSGRFKNVLGSFYPPLASINDVSLLQSLPAMQIAAGFAEIIKMAVVVDSALFELVEGHGAALLASRFQEPASAARAIMQRAEASMLRELKGNLFETKLKRLVDFGHSFSIAIESDSDYRIPHGIAVGLDMVISTGIAVGRGLCAQSVLDRMLDLYRTVDLPASQQVCSAERLHECLTSVRAHRGGALNLVVPKEIGQAIFIQDASIEELKRTLKMLAEAQVPDVRPRI